MATERVSLSMDKAALAAARIAAAGENLSLSEWLSKVAWTRAIEHAAKVSADQDRRLPNRLGEWDHDGADRVFGRDVA
jgi:hypothetical protein